MLNRNISEQDTYKTKRFNKFLAIYSVLTIITIIALIVIGETQKILFMQALSVGTAIGYLLFGISYVFSQ